MAIAKTDTRAKEFKILYPEHDVELCGHKFTIRQWGARKALENAKKLQGPFIKLATSEMSSELLAEIYDEAYEEIAEIISEDYDLDRDTVDNLPATDAVRAFKGIIEANLSFFGELSEIQKILPMNK